MRQIETAGYDRVIGPANLGPVPDLRWLRVDQLRVDPAYQRDVTLRGKAHIKRIVEGFDWRLFSAVVVSPIAGGFFAIIDGQHRVTAAAICGQDSVPCQIIQADAQMQARAFEAINGRTIPVTRDQRFKAELAAGDAEACRVDRLTREAGIKMMTYTPHGPAMKPGECLAHGAMRKLCAAFPDDHAAFVLKCIRASAGDIGGRAMIAAPFVLAAMEAFQDHPNWFSRAFVLSGFEALDPVTAQADARQRVANSRGLTLRDCFVAAILESVERAEKRAGRPA